MASELDKLLGVVCTLRVNTTSHFLFFILFNIFVISLTTDGLMGRVSTCLQHCPPSSRLHLHQGQKDSHLCQGPLLNWNGQIRQNHKHPSISGGQSASLKPGGKPLLHRPQRFPRRTTFLTLFTHTRSLWVLNQALWKGTIYGEFGAGRHSGECVRRRPSPGPWIRDTKVTMFTVCESCLKIFYFIYVSFLGLNLM